jgi:AmmeMemoRadiSam system protein A
VVSSDFTHWGERYGYYPFRDNPRENITKLDGMALSHIFSKDLDGFLKFENDTQDTICGFFPCSILLGLLPQECHPTLLNYYTSQDVHKEEKDSSVSYMSIAFSGTSWPQNAQAGALNSSEEKDLLKLARATVEAYVRNKEKPDISKLAIKITPKLKENCGVFVTLNKVSDPKTHKKELRGCIGNIWPAKSIYQAVIDNAINACSADYRFESVKADELKDLKIEISVLTPPKRIESYKQIQLGKDGIILMDQGKQAVFLPHVPTEQGWNLEETLHYLSLKAGLPADAWQKGAKFDVFQTQLFEENH